MVSGRDEVVLWISVHPNVKLTFHRRRQEYVEFYHQPPGLCFHCMLFRYIQLYLGAFAFKKRLLVLSYPSVCPYACIRGTSTGQTVVKFHILDFSLIFLNTYRFLFKSHSNNTLYEGCPESVRTFKIARHCVDLAGRSKCYSLVMSLTNCVAKTTLLYLA
jgi:hypothetical protein